ncbi:NUDIX hydrolase [Ruegeria pomeroyi]|uniref:NUDIX hydrolase n=1 Tax=Ruegeria alba TaxID=2916756 RepID=A0ABS9NUK3_9RHOB|nr:NUDIX hydrolase [Ruegeria pomeroyi]MCG6557906.1 NUDIX hydrolase [Ruegeria alba]MCE8521578.1 NUDIX hydrolase [Ruegeria pomeroyi]MCE8525229.1 NUDIX hydrolase [Ruegeria pomeroyi]MCE8529263.1 NUDIX hydrolase [Ruegeria pomeroyi]
MVGTGEQFVGAKLALFLGEQLLVIRRDDRPDIPWPDYWDLPGGGREGDETPLDCALRETHEEVGLVVPVEQVGWNVSYSRPGGRMWFFAAHLSVEYVKRIRFGNEGQGWRLMAPAEYIHHARAVPHFADHLRLYLDSDDYGRARHSGKR